jgi:hypothetical protein
MTENKESKLLLYKIRFVYKSKHIEEFWAKEFTVKSESGHINSIEATLPDGATKKFLWANVDEIESIWQMAMIEVDDDDSES